MLTNSLISDYLNCKYKVIQQFKHTNETHSINKYGQHLKRKLLNDYYRRNSLDIKYHSLIADKKISLINALNGGTCFCVRLLSEKIDITYPLITVPNDRMEKTDKVNTLLRTKMNTQTGGK